MLSRRPARRAALSFFLVASPALAALAMLRWQPAPGPTPAPAQAATYLSAPPAGGPLAAEAPAMPDTFPAAPVDAEAASTFTRPATAM